MKRIAIVATPAPLPDMRPAPGSLDGDAIRTRLPIEDIGLELVDIDPRVDFAEQLEDWLDAHPPARDDEVMIYASCGVMTSEEGELFLCLDPAEPETGDSLADLAIVLHERVPGRAVFFLECRHPEDPDDSFRSTTIAAAAKEAVRPAETGIALLIAARPLSAEPEDRPSPMTRAFLDALDDADEQRGLTIEAFFEQAREALGETVPAFLHAKGRGGFQLLARPPRTEHPPPLDDTDDWDVPTAPESSRARAQQVSKPPPPPPVSKPPPPPKVVATTNGDLSPVSERRVSQPPMVLPSERSFQREEPQLPKVMISERPPPPPSGRPPASAVPESVRPPISVAGRAPLSNRPPPVSAPPPASSGEWAEHVGESVRLIGLEDYEGALAALKRALGVLAPHAAEERADVFKRVGEIKVAQGKRREAISNYEKALTLVPTHRRALESLIDLDEREGDWRAVQATEDRLIATIKPIPERFARLMEFGSRWQRLGIDDPRARSMLEKARGLMPEDDAVLASLSHLYEKMGRVDDVIETRRTIARVAKTPRIRAETYSDLASYCLLELKREELALELFDLALESDPSLLDPLTVVARLLAERQEWGELEIAYRKMLDRAPRIPELDVRAEVTWELCRRLGTLFRDHLEDPALALDAFEDALEEKPDDPATRKIAADLARSIGQSERAAPHLQALARLEPLRSETFHELFELFQRTRRLDEAFGAACVTMHLKVADARERIIFEEHKPEGVPGFTRPIRQEAWELLRVAGRDRNVEAVLEAIAPAAIAARLAELGADGKLPTLDPALRQDLQRSTASIVRSFSWASHFFSTPAPAIYVHEEATLPIASVIAEEPSVITGAPALRGRSVAELGFLVGRHLAYHVGAHRLILYYPSLEDLSTCFVAAVTIASPNVQLPASIEAAASELRARMEPRLSDEGREALIAAVRGFEAEKKRAKLAAWVGAVERAATRAGFVAAGDLDVAAAILRAESRGLVDAELKIQDLWAYAVSDAHHMLREELGVAIDP